MTLDEDLMDPYGAHLLGLAFVDGVSSEAPGDRRADLVVVLRTPSGAVRLSGTLKRSHLTRTGVQALLSELGAEADRWILLAPHIGRPMGNLLRSAGLNYMDAGGNCFLRIGHEYMASVEGRRATRPEGSRGVRAAGAMVLFALLAEEDLLSQSLRVIGTQAGASHQAALDAVVRLQEAHDISREGRRRTWLPGGRRSALSRWLGEYETVLRPWLNLGRYRTMQQTPDQLDAVLALHVASGACLLGGVAAGDRLVAYYRGAGTVVHVQGAAGDLARGLPALKDPAGNLTLLRLPGPLAAQGAIPGTVHPLFVYAEMMYAKDDRAREAAAMVRAQYLSDFV